MRTAVLVATLTAAAPWSPALAQPITVEADLTGGYTTDDAGALATQLRAFGDAPLGLRVFAEAAWAARSETDKGTNAFGAAYPYGNRVQVIEAYAERLFRPGPGLIGFRAGRYRTPFGIYTRSDYAYAGLLRAPLIRYDGYFALSNNYLEHGAELIKIFPALLIPALFSRRRWAILLASGVTILLGYLPYLPGAGLQVLGHLPRFLADPNELFNPSLMGLVFLLTSFLSRAPAYWASWVGKAALLCMVGWLLRRDAETSHDLLARVWIVAGTITLFTLTLHPWYLLWLVPFLAIQPRPAWLYLSGAVAVSYTFYVTAPSTRALIGALEYLPFFFLLFWQWRRHRGPASGGAHVGFAREIP